MSLTVALDDHASLVNAFFDEHLPHHESLIRPWVKALQRRALGKPTSASRTPHLVGAAIEIRIGFDLAQSCRTATWPQPSLRRRGVDAISALGFEPPANSGIDAELSTWRKVASHHDRDLLNDRDQQIAAARLCWQMAYVQTIAHELPRTSLNSTDALTAFWTHVRPEPPSEAIDVLLRLWRQYLDSARSTLAGFGEPVTVRPSFANRFAVGDLLLGQTVIEVKCEQRPQDSLSRTLRQVVGCALAESDDDMSINSIGVYHAYEGCVVHWPLAQALQSLAATGRASLTELRACFSDTIAAERRSIEERGR